MLLKLDSVFAPFYSLSFFWFGLTPFHLNKKYRKWTDIFWVKTFSLCIPTKLKIFYANPNDNLKNRCYSKIILGHAVFQLLFESNFSWQHFLLLNSCIRWQWLLFHLIKARGKYKQVIKFRYTWLLLRKDIQNDVSVDWIWSCSLDRQLLIPMLWWL